MLSRIATEWLRLYTSRNGVNRTGRKLGDLCQPVWNSLGHTVKCPFCNWRGRNFLPYGVEKTPNRCCPRCGSIERYRLLYVYLFERTSFFEERLRILEVAPSKCFRSLAARLPNIEYVSIDLNSDSGMAQVDLGSLPFPAHAFDLVICFRVLEQVKDDLSAMREMLRTLKPGGFAILQVPVEDDRAATFEDPSVRPDDYEKVFGDSDSVRIYGLDFTDRMAAAGFCSIDQPVSDEFGVQCVETHALRPGQNLYVGMKPRDYGPGGESLADPGAAHFSKIAKQSLSLKVLDDSRKLAPSDRLTRLLDPFRPAVKEVCADKAYDATDDWSISLFPDGYSFAFTIVHDADAAYSRRLEPLFEVFDEFGFKITVTVFTFWADWAKNGKVWLEWRGADDDEFFAPNSVPLADENERRFYLDLAARGHEIGIHTPSETSDTREDVIRAFEYFKEVFGRYPRIYVEHAVTRNKEGQASEGSKPESIYFNTDLLNAYEPWVWIDDDCGVPDKSHRRFYDILAVNGSPFNTVAPERYGIAKAFLRTGKWREADGDGFLAWYSEENIDALEKNRGLALVYMHLDAKWIDAETKQMRTPIMERLRYLASKNGWFVPAGVILDRVRAVHKLKLYHSKRRLKLVNTGNETIEGLTITSNTGRSLRSRNKKWTPGSRGEIVVGTIHPGETLWFKIV